MDVDLRDSDVVDEGVKVLDVVDSLLTKASADTMKLPKCMNLQIEIELQFMRMIANKVAWC